MDNFNKGQTDFRENGGRRQARIEETTNDILDNGKKLANELYEGGVEKANELYKEGLEKMSEAEEQVREYSDELVQKVRQNPLSSLLIAGAVGFVISALLKK